MTTKSLRSVLLALCVFSLLAPQYVLAQKQTPPSKPFDLTVVLNNVTLHTNGYYGLGIYGSNGNSHSEAISDPAEPWNRLSK